jgi:hypothetical protein
VTNLPPQRRTPLGPVFLHPIVLSLLLDVMSATQPAPQQGSQLG